MPAIFSATYSPEDNKLRLYASSRLDDGTYQRVRAAGFIWAPKQDLFVAPMWTPERAELCDELAGEIGDEDTSLVERAELRADRFSDYSGNRAADSAQASEAVRRITDGIPLGQPILVGHHSERHARKDAEKIENGMRKAVKLWETSKYWTDRAAGALRHAKFKELPGVRARRIKGIEAAERKAQRTVKEHAAFLAGFQRAANRDEFLRVANYCWLSQCFPLADYPRAAPASQYEGAMSLHSAVADNVIDWQQGKAIALRSLSSANERAAAWLTHFANRLAYERAMLEEQGASALLAKKPRTVQLPLCNYQAVAGLEIPNMYRRGEQIHYPQVSMTQAAYAQINKDYKGTRVVGNSHRVRTALIRHSLVCVFLTDAKIHAAPEAIGRTMEPPCVAPASSPRRVDDTPADIRAMRESLRGGVSVVAVPQLFPTPAALAARMVALADISPADRVLEPSAGTGAILKALPDSSAKVAVEINPGLIEGLTRMGVSGLLIHEADFLRCNGELGSFDRIVMNPPFKDGADIAHILHAVRFLKAGGRLVALCADGPRQAEKLRALAEGCGGSWESLPEGTFAEHGTNVRVAMLVIEGTA
jgi:protein-L-isoaspartate O-methyltransferase